MALPTLTAPKYEITIPSTQQRIFFRPYLVSEEKVLLLALESEDQNQILNAMKDIISVCTFNAVDPNKLATFDVEYLFLKIRAKTVGEVAKVGLKCAKCGEVTQVEIDLDTISVKQQENMPSNRIALTDTIGVVLRWPALADISTIDQKQNDLDAMVAIVRASIDRIYDKDKVYPTSDHTTEELNAFICSMDPKQLLKIQQYIEAMPRLEHKVCFKCSNKKCGENNELVLAGLKSFFV